MESEFVHHDYFIYKYVPFSLNTLKMLIKGELWFGFPLNLNDPFEGEFIIEDTGAFPNDDFLKEFYEKDLKIPAYRLLKKVTEVKANPNLFQKDIGEYIKNILEMNME